MSADPVPARRPCAIVTKQLERTGLKRLELNTVPKYQGVTERTLDKFMRRGLVMVYKALFQNPALARRALAAT